MIANSLKRLAVTEPFWLEPEREDRHDKIGITGSFFFVSLGSVFIRFPFCSSQSLTF